MSDKGESLVPCSTVIMPGVDDIKERIVFDEGLGFSRKNARDRRRSRAHSDWRYDHSRYLDGRK